MIELLADVDDLFVNLAGLRAFHPRPQTRPLTRFEQRGAHLGHQVRDLIFRRRSSAMPPWTAELSG